MVSLEDKIMGYSIAVVSGVASVAGGFLSGWYKAQGLEVQHENLLTYGPVMMTSAALGVYSGIESFSKAKKDGATTKDTLLPVVMSTASGASFGGFFGSYNTICFFIVGYIAGTIAK